MNMMWNYLVSAARNARKHPSFSVVNVVGLALACTAVLGILLFVLQETDVDRFHTNGDRLYRLNKIVLTDEGGEERHAITSGKMGPTLASDLADVEAAVRVLPWFNPYLTESETKGALLSDIVLADANFFNVFDFELTRGRRDEVLREPQSIVLTESTAMRLFGSDDPVGRTVTSVGDVEYTVSGIAADPPDASHLKFSAIISWETTVPGVGELDWSWLNNWLTQVTFTYVVLANEGAAARVDAALPSFMERHFPERANQYLLYLQPMQDVYLHSADLRFVSGIRTGNIQYVRIMVLVGLLILVLAGINFTNLSLARAVQRSREVGVRKALGAARGQLAMQFLGESALHVGVALLLAFALVQSMLPFLGELTGKPMDPRLFAQPAVLVGIFGLAIAVASLAGFYPAVVMSRMHAVGVFGGGRTGGATGSGLRRALVVIQFAATIALMVVTGIVYQQVRFSEQQDTGFLREGLAVVRLADTDVATSAEAFKALLLELPGVESVTISGRVPGTGVIGFGIEPEGASGQEDLTSNAMRLSDAEFFDTYGMSVVVGRGFESGRPADATGVVINETLARRLGWSDPVGKRLGIPGELEDGVVIGVVKDFHYESVHQAIGPMVLFMAHRPNYATIRFSGDLAPEEIEAVWKTFDPVSPFDGWSMDERWSRMYSGEQTLLRTLGVFVLISLVVACLGLFGLSLLLTMQRTKEIGVRKVLGASASGIVRLVAGEYMALVLAGGVVAIPVAWFVAADWLGEFAYSISPGPGVFAGPIGLALFVAFLSVAGQALRSARLNPADSLRTE